METIMSDCSQQLCARAKAGDMAAATQLITLHYQKVYAFLRRLCGSDDDAADLTQRTFSRVWAALGSYEGRSSFSTWVHGIGRHVYLDWRRNGNRLDPKSDEWWETCAADGPSPFEDAAERDEAAHLYALVASLDEEKREVIHLHYFQGLSLRETAEVLDIATSTVKYRLREALDFLRSKPMKPFEPSKLKGQS
jgi:RNA polymerase sigma-70 factor (ECF subfamily)